MSSTFKKHIVFLLQNIAQSQYQCDSHSSSQWYTHHHDTGCSQCHRRKKWVEASPAFLFEILFLDVCLCTLRHTKQAKQETQERQLTDFPYTYQACSFWFSLIICCPYILLLIRKLPEFTGLFYIDSDWTKTCFLKKKWNKYSQVSVHEPTGDLSTSKLPFSR